MRPLTEQQAVHKVAENRHATRQLQRRPGDVVPGQLFVATSTTDIAASYTTIDWTDDGAATTDAATITVNGAANVELAAAGMYRFELFSRGWGSTALVGTEITWELNVVSGSEGVWSSKLVTAELVSTEILRVNDSADQVDVSGGLGPSAHATAAWISTDTFPVEIEVQVAKFENGVAVADTNPDFRFAVILEGTVYEPVA